MPKPPAKPVAAKSTPAKSVITKPVATKPAALKPEAPKAAAPKPVAPPPVAPTPSVPLRTTGLSPKQQKLQAMLAKAAHQTSGAKPAPGASAQSFSAKSTGGFKKTSFQRKAV